MCCQQTVGHTFNQSLTHTFTLHCTVNMLFTNTLCIGDTFRSSGDKSSFVFSHGLRGFRIQMQPRTFLYEVKSLGGMFGGGCGGVLSWSNVAGTLNN